MDRVVVYTNGRGCVSGAARIRVVYLEHTSSGNITSVYFSNWTLQDDGEIVVSREVRVDN